DERRVPSRLLAERVAVTVGGRDQPAHVDAVGGQPAVEGDQIPVDVAGWFTITPDAVGDRGLVDDTVDDPDGVRAAPGPLHAHDPDDTDPVPDRSPCRTVGLRSAGPRGPPPHGRRR